MNREIKFRAWHPLLCDMFDNVVIADGKALRRGYFATDVNTDFSDKLIIMQYTGLKDKNGKEIYEGDIVQFKENYTNNPADFTIGVITYDEEYAGFTIKSNQYQYGIGEDTESFDIYSQVIGNIYENPELLTNN